MEGRLFGEESYVPRKMDFYIDRAKKENYIEIADQCAKGILILWDMLCWDSNDCLENIFCQQFDGNDALLKKEYLFAMDYLTYVLSAYKNTRKEIYRVTFEKYIEQFYMYIEENGPIYEELPIYAQILLIIKAFDILGNIPHQEVFLALLRKYADWLMDDSNYESDNNHGMFQNSALLHLSVLFGKYFEAALWKNHAVKRIKLLFEKAYYSDFTNNENSIEYFKYNNYLYEEAIGFCKYYGIDGIMEIEDKLKQSKDALVIFAHQDRSFPLIGDGRIFNSTGSNGDSKLFSDIGIAVLKVEETYLSFKCKTIYQAHAHTDVSSITARYKNIDFLIDTGQYNYDRYTPINRYVRSTAGHSGIFPLYADNLFQKDFCDLLHDSGIVEYKHDGEGAFVKGEYRLGDIAVCREIFVCANEIVVKDSWHSEKPTVMRQRFVIPKELIAQAAFEVSKHVLESKVENIRCRFEIISTLPDAMTVVQFGVAAPQYNAYEETMLLDTFVENTVSGEITAKITFEEEE